MTPNRYTAYSGNATNQNTIGSKIKIYYPFHPLCGHEFELLRKSNHKDGSVLMGVPDRFNKQIPLWMTEQLAAGCRISDKPEISLKALFSLVELLDCCEEESGF